MEITIGSHKFRVEMLILMAVLVWIIAGHLLCGCCRVNLMEGLENKVAAVAAGQKKKTEEAAATESTETTTTTTTEGFRTSTGPTFADIKGPNYIIDPATWNAPPSTGNAGIPIGDDELNMFAKTEFKPECCPSAYSTSSGCACMSNEQKGYLKSRGGNNVPFSEY